MAVSNTKAFNGSYVSFANTNAALLRRITLNQSSAEVKVSGDESNTHIYEGGLPDVSIEIEAVGGAAIAVNDKNSLTVMFNDSTTYSLTNALCVQNNVTGQLDGEILRTLKFRPTE
jgi:hypothetical protein